MAGDSAETRPVSLRPGRAGLGLAAVGILVAILVWWLGHSGFDWDRFRLSFSQAEPFWLSLSVSLILVTYLGRALRWQAMILPLKPKPRLGVILEASIVGFTATVIAGRAGELVRPYLIARREGLSISSQAAVWFLERLLDLIAVLVLFGFALTRLDTSDAAQVGPQIRWVFESGGRLIAGIGALSLLVLVAFRSFSRQSVARIEAALTVFPERQRERVSRLIYAFADGMESTRDGRIFALVCFFTLLEWAVISWSYYFLLRSFPATAALTFADALALVGFVAFGGVVQLPGIGGGMQIVTVLVLTQLFGLAAEPASAVALMVWIAGVLSIVPIGIVLAFRHGFWREIFGGSER